MKREKEFWEWIDGFDYMISTYGNILSYKAKDGMLRKLYPTDNGHGYKRIALWKEGKGYYKRISRLVAETFIPNPESKPEVNHKDLNKGNNYYKNLEWCTHSEHEIHTIANKRHPSGEKIVWHKLTEKQVSHIRYIYKKYKPLGFVSQRQMARDFNVCQSTIGYILRNETWKTYKDDNN